MEYKQFQKIAWHPNEKEKEVNGIYRMSSVGSLDGYFDNSVSDIHARFENGDNTSRFGVEERNLYIKSSDYKNKAHLYYKKLEDLARYS